MSNIIEAGDLPQGTQVYMKKDWLGYRIVQPIKNPDGTWNWFNLLTGGKRNLVTLLFMLFLALMLYLGINELISNYQIIAENPCTYCAEKVANLVEIKPF